MDISELDPSDTAAFDELWTLVSAARRHDQPEARPVSKRSFRAEVDNRDPELARVWRLARIDGRLVGAGVAMNSLAENRHMQQVHVVVDPDHRRRGIGTALLRLATDAARDSGRTLQNANTGEPLSAGSKRTTDGRDFLLHHGFRIVHSSRGRRFDLAGADPAVEQRLLDESWPHAADYDLVQWSGTTPAEYAPGAAALASRLIADVPFGEQDLEEVTFDAERFLRKEAVEMSSGRVFVNSYARHRDSGEFVAHSVIAVNEETPQYGDQWITLVHPLHRGHRLGLILKIENHRLLRRTHPGVRVIETVNAEVNAHMVAINDKLGFVATDRHLDFQREL